MHLHRSVQCFSGVSLLPSCSIVRRSIDVGAMLRACDRLGRAPDGTSSNDCPCACCCCWLLAVCVTGLSNPLSANFKPSTANPILQLTLSHETWHRVLTALLELAKFVKCTRTYARRGTVTFSRARECAAVDAFRPAPPWWASVHDHGMQ